MIGGKRPVEIFSETAWSLSGFVSRHEQTGFIIIYFCEAFIQKSNSPQSSKNPCQVEDLVVGTRTSKRSKRRMDGYFNTSPKPRLRA